jgi:L-alanine-DL-glutamate epimerase-like enolase superfamily enzyme
MASLHAYCTVQNATRPHEFSTEFSGPLDDVHELYGDVVIPKDGNMYLSDRPGLGIQLNETAVAKLTVTE